MKQNYNNKYSLYCWGFSKYFQTGLTKCQYSLEPNLIPISLPSEINSIYASENNTAFITIDGSTYIFGKNTFGQIGDGTKTQTNIPKLLSIKCAKLSLGAEHCIALTNNNILYGWGLNIFGQLGLGHNESISSPTVIDKFAVLSEQEGGIFHNEIPRNSTDEIVIEIATGAQHSMILTSKNILYACGFAKNGALGYFNIGNELEPAESLLFTKIPTKTTTKEYNKIACGVNHSGCLLGKTEILLWGKGDFFEFEGIKRFNLDSIINSNINNNNTKIGSDILSLSNTLNNESIQTSDEGKHTLIDIQIGNNFIMILTSNGDVYCSGNNEYGQLGIGPIKRKHMFEKVNINTKVQSISVGYNYTYALSSSNKVYAWGNNRYGQCLDLEKDICPLPMEIIQLNNLNPLSIACGAYHVACVCVNDNKKQDTISMAYNYKHIPLNSAFDPERYEKESLVIKQVNDLILQQMNIEEEIKEKEMKIKEMEKALGEKSKIIKKERKENQNKQKYSYLNINNNNNNPNKRFELLLNEEIKLKELTFIDKYPISKSYFGEVKVAYWRQCLVAVKFLQSNLETQEDQILPFIEEFNLLKSLRHPNILLFIGGCISGPQYYIVTEYCERGNLFNLLHGERPYNLDNKSRLLLALQIAKGINYLHLFNPPILHRNLTSLNILLNCNYQIKISDFGWAKVKNNQMTKLRGTFQWMAPEVIITDNYNEKADVYSFGIILWEFWSVEPPYKDVSPKDVAINVKKDKHYRPKIPAKMPNEIVHLMKKCWDYDPLQRPNFSEIIFYIESCLSKIP